MTQRDETPGGREYQVLTRQICYEGFFRLERLGLVHSLHGGGMSPVLSREIVERGDVAAVLLYDPCLDRVVMIEQFRVGAMGDSRGPWLLEIVAGLIELGETPEDVARREAVEEAGCVIQTLEPITRFYATPAKSSERSYLYCGLVDAANVGGVHGLVHEGEDIRVVPLAAEDALALVDNGTINSAWPIIALQWLARHRERLRANGV